MARKPERRLLIVNADDFGLSAGVNAGIAETHERGIVSSASLMVRQGAAAPAAAYAGRHTTLAVGLHLDLSAWDYVERRPLAGAGRATDSAEAIEVELRGQLDTFRRLLDRDPTHLDSHHHVHMAEPARSIAARLADELGVPLRGGRIRYEGRFFGRATGGEPLPRAIGVDSLLGLISALPPGWTELGCHPGLAMGGESSYDRERQLEVETLCDRRVRSAVATAGVELCSFAELD